MSTRFTPGPWIVEEQKPFGGDKGGYQINAEGIDQLAYIWNEDHRWTPDRYQGPCFGSQRAQADAALIADAPEMYRLLSKLCELHEISDGISARDLANLVQEVSTLLARHQS